MQGALLTCLWLLVLTAAAGAATASPNFKIRAPLPLPGSCNNDLQCPLGWACGNGGVCEALDGTRFPIGPAYTKLQLGFIISFGSLAIFLGSALYFCCSVQCDLRRIQSTPGRVSLLAALGVMLASIFLLSFGSYLRAPIVRNDVGAGANCTTPWDLDCSPYQCDVPYRLCYTLCFEDTDCASPTVCASGQCMYKETQGDQVGVKISGALSPGLIAVVVISVSIPVSACIACVLRTAGSSYHKGRNCFRGCACALPILVLILTLSLAMPSREIQYEFPGDGVGCSANAPCAPYYCDVNLNKCRTHCAEDIECLEGFHCLNAQCRPEDSGIISTKWTGARAAALAIGLSVFLCLVFVLLCSLWTRVAGMSQSDQNTAFLLAAAACTMVAVILFFSLYFPLSQQLQVTDAPTNSAGANCSIVAARVCEPYYCDVLAQRCATECEEDTQCMPSTSCQQGKCQSQDAESSSALFLHTYDSSLVSGAAFMVGAGALLLVLFVLGRVSPYRQGLNYLTEQPVRCWRLSFGSFLAAFTVAFIVGGVLASQGRELVGVGGGALRSTTPCEGVLASACYPHTCDITTKTCMASCDTDMDCMLGAQCLPGSVNGTTATVCTPLPTRPLLHGFQLAAALIALATAVMIASFFIVGCAWARCSCSLAPCYGVYHFPQCMCIGSVTFVVLTAVMVGGGLLLAVAEFPFIPNGVAEGAQCASPEAFQCDPYYCDLRRGACFSSCAATSDCRPGWSCVAGSCENTNDRGSVSALWLSLTGSLLALIMLPVGPRIGNAINRRTQEREQRRMEARLAEEEAQTRLLAQAKHDHPVVLDIDPANPRAVDPSLPSPGVFTPMAGAPSLGLTPTGTTIPGAEFPGLPTTPTNWRCECGADNRGKDQCVACAKPRPVTLRQTVVQGSNGKMERIPVIEAPRQPGITAPAPVTLLPPPAGRVRTTEKVCSICFTEPSTVRMVGRSCKHGFCNTCAKLTLESAYAEGQFPARCPGCRAEHPDPPTGGAITETIERSYIPAEVLERLANRLVITTDFARRFIQMQLLKAFAPEEIVTCPVCTMLCVAPDPMRKDKSDLKATCPECNISFCCKCSSIWHGHKGMDCEAFAKYRKRYDDDRSMQLIARTAKKCPTCGMGIIHYRGHACHHIRPGDGCPNCHTHFCAVCAMPWPCNGQARFPHTSSCDQQCDCPTCPDCKPNRPCPHCPGGPQCPSCNGRTGYEGRPLEETGGTGAGAQL